MKINEQAHKNLSEIIDRKSEHLWKLHKKIGMEYSDSWQPLRDMVELGRQAEALLKVREAFPTMVEISTL